MMGHLDSPGCGASYVQEHGLHDASIDSKLMRDHNKGQMPDKLMMMMR